MALPILRFRIRSYDLIVSTKVPDMEKALLMPPPDIPILPFLAKNIVQNYLGVKNSHNFTRDLIMTQYRSIVILY